MKHAQRSVTSILRAVAVIGIALSIVACGKPSETAKPVSVKATVFDDVIANKERAKLQSEQAMQQNKEKLDAAMKDAEGAGTH